MYFEPELGPLQYKFTLLCLVIQVVFVCSRRPAFEGYRDRPSWDASWFLPVYVWGLESSFIAFSILALPSRFCFGVPFQVVGLEGVRAFLVGGATVVVCFACEGTARRRLLAARSARAALPIGVVGALLCVHMTWLAVGLATVPLLTYEKMTEFNSEADEADEVRPHIRFTTAAREFDATHCALVRSGAGLSID